MTWLPHAGATPRRDHGLGSRMAVVFDVVRDVRLAVRGIRRRPGFAAAVMLTLTLGIGASTAVFSVVNAVLLNPLPHADAGQLVILWETDQRTNPPGTRNNVSPANFADWRGQNRVFEDLAAYSIGRATLTGAGDAEMVTRAWVTSQFLPLLRARVRVGRGFAAGEDSRSAMGNEVVLSHAFWSRRYAGDPNIIGTTIALNGDSYTVIGVLERGVDFLQRGVQVWTPLGLTPSDFQDRGARSLNVLARMKPGMTVPHAQSEMDGIADRIRLEDREWMTGRGVNVVSLRDELVGRVEPTLVVLFGAVLVLLCIATVNVANLLLVRTTERRRELAVQAALGATRSQLIRRSLAECLVLSVVGGGLGLALAVLGTDTLLAFAPRGVPGIDGVGIDARVLGFALVLSLVTGCTVGILPALQSPGTRLGDALKEGGRTATKDWQKRTRRGLVVAQVGLSMMMLVAAGLLTRAFYQLNRIDPGFSADRVLTAKVRLPARRYPDITSMTAFYDELLRAVRALPQVSSASLTRFLPLSDGPWTFTFEVEGQPVPQLGRKLGQAYNPVSTDYFQTAGIALLQGRGFTRADNVGAPPVLVINEAMRRAYWPNEDPVGQRVRFDFEASSERWRTIVGVVSDVHQDALQLHPRPIIYGPQPQAFTAISDRMRLVVRTSGDPLQLAQPVYRIVRDIDPDLPVFDVRTAHEILAGSIAQQRFSMLLIDVFCTAATLLALIGIYGVMSHTVRERAHELGLRIALGSSTGNVVRFVLGEGLALALIGIAAGLGGALVASHMLGALLYGVSTTDPLVYVGSAVALAVAAGVACFVPAYQAAIVDPVAVLRPE